MINFKSITSASHLTLRLVLITIAILYLQGCKEQPPKLDDTILIEVVKVRTYKSYDGKMPVEKKDRNWINGDMVIKSYDTGFSSSKILAGTRSVQIGSTSYTVTCNHFAPYNKNKGIRPKGIFCELMVSFKNTGGKVHTVWFNSSKKSPFDANLSIPDDTLLPVKGFRIPGLNIAKISLVTAWKGKLGIRLKPGEQTKMLLIFDVPEKLNAAKLQIKDSPAFDVTI